MVACEGPRELKRPTDAVVVSPHLDAFPSMSIHTAHSVYHFVFGGVS